MADGCAFQGSKLWPQIYTRTARQCSVLQQCSPLALVLWGLYTDQSTPDRAVGLYSAYGEVRLSCKNIQATGTSRVGLEITWTVVCVLKMLLDFLEIEQLFKTQALPRFHLCDVCIWLFSLAAAQCVPL